MSGPSPMERRTPRQAVIATPGSPRQAFGAAAREEQCEGCQRFVSGRAMRNVRVGDDTFRVLCPTCINEGEPDGR